MGKKRFRQTQGGLPGCTWWGESLRSMWRGVIERLEGYPSKPIPKNESEDSTDLWKYINRSGWEDGESVGPAEKQGGTSLMPTSSSTIWPSYSPLRGCRGGMSASSTHPLAHPLTLCLGQPQASLPEPNQPSPHLPSALLPPGSEILLSKLPNIQSSPQHPGLPQRARLSSFKDDLWLWQLKKPTYMKKDPHSGKGQL